MSDPGVEPFIAFMLTSSSPDYQVECKDPNYKDPVPAVDNEDMQTNSKGIA